MNWDELKGVWRGQADERSSAPDLRALEATFAIRQQKLATQLFWRDVREATAAVLVAAVFGYVGWQMGATGWPMVIAVALLLALAGFFVRERWRVRAESAGPDAPLLARLDAEIAEQHHQRRLLQTVGWWYLGPSLGAAMILIVVVVAHAPLPQAARWVAGGVMTGIMALVGWAVLALNRRAMRESIEPYLRELETQRAELRGAE
jgi:hypothetical protein